MTEKTQESTARQILKKIRFALICLSIFGIFVVAVVFIQWYCWGWIETNIPEEKRGAFGDMFGSINTLFSGLAFAGVLFTILLQGWELSATRSELRLSREAHQKNSDLMDEQLNVLQKTLEIEQVRLDQQFLPIFVPQIPTNKQGERVTHGSGRYVHWVKNKGKPIVNLLVEKMYKREDDTFVITAIPFLDSGETFSFGESAEPLGEPMKYHALTYNTLDGRYWRTTVVSYFSEEGVLVSGLGETVELSKNNNQ